MCIFDADQVAKRDFFLRTLPFFDGGDDVGMVLSPQVKTCTRGLCLCRYWQCPWAAVLTLFEAICRLQFLFVSSHEQLIHGCAAEIDFELGVLNVL